MDWRGAVKERPQKLEIIMTEETWVLTEREFFALFAFLITSASQLVTEPKDYGPMRLIAAATRLGSFAQPRVHRELGDLLDPLLEDIPRWQRERQRNPEGYLQFLEDCARKLAAELVRREPIEGTVDE
jgi:hypothetical protein